MLRQYVIAACACFSFPSNGVATERAVDLELVLAADISSSMDLEEAALQRQGYVRALRHPEVIEAVRQGPLGRIAVTYVEWAGYQYQRTLVDWTEVADASDATAFAEAVEQSSVKGEEWTSIKYTSISSVIAFAARRLEDNGFRGQRRIIDISGDGPNNEGIYVVHARDRAVADGIIINGLPIINDRLGPYGYPPMPDLDLYYQDCVIGGEGAFIVVANGFEDFARAIRRKMVLEIAGQAPPIYLLQFAAGRPRPPCNAGELRRPDLLHDF